MFTNTFYKICPLIHVFIFMLQTNIFANPMNQNYEEFLEVSQFP